MYKTRAPSGLPFLPRRCIRERVESSLFAVDNARRDQKKTSRKIYVLVFVSLKHRCSPHLENTKREMYLWMATQLSAMLSTSARRCVSLSSHIDTYRSTHIHIYVDISIHICVGAYTDACGEFLNENQERKRCPTGSRCVRRTLDVREGDRFQWRAQRESSLALPLLSYSFLAPRDVQQAKRATASHLSTVNLSLPPFFVAICLERVDSLVFPNGLEDCVDKTHLHTTL